MSYLSEIRLQRSDVVGRPSLRSRSSRARSSLEHATWMGSPPSRPRRRRLALVMHVIPLAPRTSNAAIPRSSHGGRVRSLEPLARLAEAIRAYTRSSRACIGLKLMS